jgi:hypothetical protein
MAVDWTHIITYTRPFVDDQQDGILAITFLKERCDCSGASTGKHFFLVEPMREDDRASGLEARLKEQGQSFV